MGGTCCSGKATTEIETALAGRIVVIAGPPAAGKGTQCEKIKERFGFVHISTGDILRDNVKNGTELGKKAKPFMDAGKLVPDELLVDLVKARLKETDVLEKGCLLDGFPRTSSQAAEMKKANIKVDRFVLLEVGDEVLVQRGVLRRLDPETGTIYHLKFKPPPKEIEGRLQHRSDDREEAIRTRLATYHGQVDAIVPFFDDSLFKVNGDQKPDEVFAQIGKSLESLGK